MSYLERIHACNNVSPERYRPLLINDTTYGQVQPGFANHLREWPEVFCVTENTVTLNPKLNNYASRTETVAPVLHTLYQQGVIDTWVEEAYPVTLSFKGHTVMEVERAATPFLGIKTFGIHVNGLVRKADGIQVWIGTRTLSKPFWPGKLDQMVAGGQPVGMGLLENVIKEAEEEAGIPGTLACQAQFVGTVSYRQQGWRGLDNSTIYIYDLWLPEHFLPENTDGEVTGFELMPLAKLAHLTETTDAFKDNCNLVNIDLLLRLGWLNEHHPDYTVLRESLYSAEM